LEALFSGWLLNQKIRDKVFINQRLTGQFCDIFRAAESAGVSHEPGWGYASSITVFWNQGFRDKVFIKQKLTNSRAGTNLA
jgi:hypothetical protein